MADVLTTASLVQHSTGATLKSGTAGHAVTAGNPVAISTSSQVYRADVTDATLHKLVGVAVNSAPGAGQPVSYVVRDDDFTPGFAVTTGTIYVVSADGAVSPSADLTTNDYTGFVGIGKSTTKIKVDITSNNYVDSVI